jgi:hypothetical protein
LREYRRIATLAIELNDLLIERAGSCQIVVLGECIAGASIARTIAMPLLVKPLEMRSSKVPMLSIVFTVTAVMA